MEERIVRLLKEREIDITENRGVNLLTSGMLDSFEIVNFVMDLEDEFEVEIDPELVIPENFETLMSICELIKNILKEEQ